MNKLKKLFNILIILSILTPKITLCGRKRANGKTKKKDILTYVLGGYLIIALPLSRVIKAQEEGEDMTFYQNLISGKRKKNKKPEDVKKSFLNEKIKKRLKKRLKIKNRNYSSVSSESETGSISSNKISLTPLSDGAVNNILKNISDSQITDFEEEEKQEEVLTDTKKFSYKKRNTKKFRKKQSYFRKQYNKYGFNEHGIHFKTGTYTNPIGLTENKIRDREKEVELLYNRIKIENFKLGEEEKSDLENLKKNFDLDGLKDFINFKALRRHNNERMDSFEKREEAKLKRQNAKKNLLVNPKKITIVKKINDLEKAGMDKMEVFAMNTDEINKKHKSLFGNQTFGGQKKGVDLINISKSGKKTTIIRGVETNTESSISKTLKNFGKKITGKFKKTKIKKQRQKSIGSLKINDLVDTSDFKDKKIENNNSNTFSSGTKKKLNDLEKLDRNFDKVYKKNKNKKITPKKGSIYNRLNSLVEKGGKEDIFLEQNKKLCEPIIEKFRNYGLTSKYWGEKYEKGDYEGLKKMLERTTGGTNKEVLEREKKRKAKKKRQEKIDFIYKSKLMDAYFLYYKITDLHIKEIIRIKKAEILEENLEKLDKDKQRPQILTTQNEIRNLTTSVQSIENLILDTPENEKNKINYLKSFLIEVKKSQEINWPTDVLRKEYIKFMSDDGLDKFVEFIKGKVRKEIDESSISSNMAEYLNLLRGREKAKEMIIDLVEDEEIMKEIRKAEIEEKKNIDNILLKLKTLKVGEGVYKKLVKDKNLEGLNKLLEEFENKLIRQKKYEKELEEKINN